MNKIYFLCTIIIILLNSSCSNINSKVCLSIDGRYDLSPCEVTSRKNSKVYLGIYTLRDIANIEQYAKSGGNISKLVRGEYDKDVNNHKKVYVTAGTREKVCFEAIEKNRYIFAVALFCERKEDVCTKKFVIDHEEIMQKKSAIQKLIPKTYHLYVGDGKFEETIGQDYIGNEDEESVW